MKKIIVILAGCLLLSICGCSNGENENISNEATIENVEEGTLSEDEKIDEEKYQTGIEEYNNKKYQNALDIFSLLKDYKESDRYIKKCKYEIADNMCENGEYENAIRIYVWLNGYKDAEEKGNACKELYRTQLYNELKEEYENGAYVEAYKLANSSYIAKYKDVLDIKSRIMDENEKDLIDGFETVYMNADFSTFAVYNDLYGRCDDVEFCEKYEFLQCLKEIQGFAMADESDDYNNINGWKIDYEGKEYELNPKERTVNYYGSGSWKAKVFRFAQGTKEIYCESTGHYYIIDVNDADNDSFYPGNNALSFHTYDYKKVMKKEKQEKEEMLEKKKERERIQVALSEPREPEIGMTKEEVEDSTWGKPDHINKTTYTWGVEEQWCYYDDMKYIYFKDGVVDCIQE